MKNKMILASIFIIIFSSLSFPWGDEGHRLIIKKAIEMLPEELSFLNNWKEYLAERVTDPDDRKLFDKSEDPKHYIDMDFYEEFLRGEMIYDKDSLIQKYGEEKVTEIGLLPWATLESFNNLQIAFADKDRDKILIHIADLAHYAADGHQPEHTVLNYDGQLTGQKGLHARYEIEMIHRNIKELDESLGQGYALTISDPIEFIFNYIIDASFKNDILLASDRIASQYAGVNGDDYYKILWFRTKNLSVEQFSKAASAIASLIFTAWNNAGRPAVNEIN